MPNQSQPNPPKEAKPKKTSLLAILILIAVLLGAIIIAGYCYFIPEDKENKNVGQTLTNVNSNQNSSLVEDISDWQNYTNFTYHFTIKCPRDYFLEEKEKSYTFKKIFPFEAGGYLNPIHYVRVAIFDNKDTGYNKTIYDWAVSGFPENSKPAGYNFVEEKTVGENKYRIYSVASGVDTVKEYFLVKNSLIYSLYHSCLGNCEISQGTNIITTFKFIDETDVWETYNNNDINISFEYPKSWGPVVVNQDDETQWGAGKETRVNSTSRTNSFGGQFQIIYATLDYAPGRENWQGEIMSEYEKNEGIKNICQEGKLTEFSGSQNFDVRDCHTKQVSGKWQTEFTTRMDSLGGTDVLHFVKMLVFQTDNPEYPAGVLALFLPDSNNIQFVGINNDPGVNGYSAQDLTNLDRVYQSFISRTADAETLKYLDEFARVVSSFQYTK